MGATNCPETPRQKMIQMMYIVYTAMLALNVSAEVLAGFKTVGDAINVSNIAISEKVTDFYNNFEDTYKNNPEKTQESWDKATQRPWICCTISIPCDMDSLHTSNNLSVIRMPKASP